ncbi:hypothetical protein I4F81_000593 [Pyropia yezoensis]|uniref:Uncharacterized protein n=1 Tax=Pyropia yezoensis TaxID=2788 RepID=A0ACC3BJP4_PYRYE|nr:hypothetical protein I4F81_000593 [Neopyropia yezoensis]
MVGEHRATASEGGQQIRARSRRQQPSASPAGESAVDGSNDGCSSQQRHWEGEASPRRHKRGIPPADGEAGGGGEGSSGWMPARGGSSPG